MSKDDVLDMLLEKGLWSSELDKQLERAQKDLENTKVKLFEANLTENEMKMGKELVFVIRNKIEELNSRRHQYDYVSCDGVAQAAKHRYLIAASLRDVDGKPLFSKDLWRENIELLDLAISTHASLQLTEVEIRHLARTDPWRTIWSTSKKCGSLFGCPSVNLSEEQKSIIIWSQMFDNIFESPDCPSDKVIEDDDRLDGWLIVQRRKRESEKVKTDISNEIKSEKIKNSDEIFIVAKSHDHISKISGMTDAYSSAIKKQRMNVLRERGVVNELDMPDTKQEMRMQFVQMEKNRGKK